MSPILQLMLKSLDIQAAGTEPEQHFPLIRLVLLIEAGTHLIVDALMCPYRMGERVRAKKLLRSVQDGMLLMWDRGLHSYAMVQATQKLLMPFFRASACQC